MKKLKLLTVVLAFGMTSLFASENIEDVNKEIRKQVVSLFDDAKFETEKDFRVYFSFTFNGNGEIVVLSADSNRNDIKNYLRKNVNSKKIQNPGIINQIYKIPIAIKITS